MLFALFLLIQSSLPGNLSKLVIVGVALFFIVGVSLLIYFLRRLKSSEKEAEEVWDVSHSLFREVPTPVAQQTIEATAAPSQATEESLSAEASLPTATSTLVSPASSALHEPSQTRLLASEPGATQLLSSEPRSEPPLTASEAAPEAVAPAVEALPAPHASEPEPARSDRATELLASPLQAPTAPADVPATPAPFDEEIWAELRDTVAPAPPAHIEPTRPLGAPMNEQASAPLVETDENEQASAPLVETDAVEPIARVESRTDRALFEPPTITPLAPRAPFAPPTITPITPRQQAEMMAEPSAPQPPPHDLYANSLSTGESAPTTKLYSQPAPPDVSPRAASLLDQEREAARHTRELATPPSVTSATPPVSGDDDWAAVSAASVSAARARRTPAGAVLGLPISGGGGPLVLGTPVKPRDEIGIGGLSNYGKPPVKEGGKGGTIALVLVLLIIGGSAAAYRFSPTVHAKVNAWVARARGLDPNETPLSPEPKVRIFPSRTPATNKNIVTASGAVENISKETFDNLSLEIALERGNGGAPEIRTVPITPAQLEPNGRGTYAFEYDGNKETGFGGGYTIKRLLSNGIAVRFTAPEQK